VVTLAGGLAMGIAGAFWGSAIGAMIPKHPVVYEADPATAPKWQVQPIAGPNRVGVSLVLRPR